MIRKNADPVHKDVAWYFWDETWGERHGPFATELEARKGLAEYQRLVLGEGQPDARNQRA